MQCEAGRDDLGGHHRAERQTQVIVQRRTGHLGSGEDNGVYFSVRVILGRKGVCVRVRERGSG